MLIYRKGWVDTALYPKAKIYYDRQTRKIDTQLFYNMLYN